VAGQARTTNQLAASVKVSASKELKSLAERACSDPLSLTPEDFEKTLWWYPDGERLDAAGTETANWCVRELARELFGLNERRERFTLDWLRSRVWTLKAPPAPPLPSVSPLPDDCIYREGRCIRW
jgi:hypothetical protein